MDRVVRCSLGALGALALIGGAAQARDPVPLSLPPPPARTVEQPVSPYPLSYADDLARQLGIVQGHMDVFTVTPQHGDGLVPTLKGGVDRAGAGFKLQWQTPN